MTQQETNDYNERCAKFLGARKLNHEYELYGMVEVIEDGENEKHFFEPKDMLFHANWNWIMEVVEAIEKMGANFNIKTLWNKFNKYSITQVTVLIEEGTVNESKYLSTISDCSTLYKRSSSTSGSKKEQVIEAINHFLIWHNSINK